MLKDSPLVAQDGRRRARAPFYDGDFESASVLVRACIKSRARCVWFGRRGRQRQLLADGLRVLHGLFACPGHSRLPGDFAEVGCFQGASTRLICEAKGDKTLHVFDTL